MCWNGKTNINIVKVKLLSKVNIIYENSTSCDIKYEQNVKELSGAQVYFWSFSCDLTRISDKKMNKKLAAC